VRIGAPIDAKGMNSKELTEQVKPWIEGHSHGAINVTQPRSS
jgi:hypothetical protein